MTAGVLPLANLHSESGTLLLFNNLFRVFTSLPEVPALVDVPSVSAQLDDSLLGLLRDRVSRHGSVSSHPPVQIEDLQERPGSILVRWCKVSLGEWKKTTYSCAD